MSTKARTGSYIDEDLLKKSHCFLEKANVRSRNEFVNEAVGLYVSHIEGQEVQNYLADHITAAMRGMLDDSENRIARLLFENAAEINMLMNIVAADCDIDDETVRALRAKCVSDAKRSIGVVSSEDTLPLAGCYETVALCGVKAQVTAAVEEVKQEIEQDLVQRM